ncbi:MAG: YkgJ family cysteine cluster protein [Desulfovibrionaceae bacterium]
MLRRRLALRLLPGGVEVTGYCRRCGQCCRRLSLWTGGDWLRTDEDVRRFLRERPEYDRLVPVGHEDDGRLVFTCTWLGPDNRCRDHDERLPLCRDYPGPELWLAGVNLPASCGFRLRGPGLDRLWRIPAQRRRRRHPDAEDMDKMCGPDNGDEA